jgi:DNA invertase Pin-like site-specific DNA recombinase
MRAAVYTRISNDPKLEGLGVARQLDDCLELAERLGWTVTARFDDNDLSAFGGKTRPGFEAMLDAMARGEVDGLLCWHTDRLYRCMKDLERLIDVADAHRVAIRTVQGGDLDLSTSAGRMVARILGSVSRQESEHKGERQKRANTQRAAAGKWVSANRPFGYTSRGEVLEPEAAMVRQAAAGVLAGKSIKQTAREWNAAGVVGSRGRPFTGPNVRRLLINPRYAAICVYNGRETGRGDWEPIIDVDTHRGLVAHLGDPSRIICTSFERKFVGSGVYRCGVCGGKLRHSVSGHPRKARYECRETNAHVVTVGAPLDAYVETVVLEALSRTDIRSRIGAAKDVDAEGLYARRAALQARLDELAGLFAEGVIDGSQLRRGTSELRTQLAGVDGALAELARTSPAAKLLDEDDDLTAAWQRSSPDIRGKIIDELCTVTVGKCIRKGPGFDYNRVAIEWK